MTVQLLIFAYFILGLFTTFIIVPHLDRCYLNGIRRDAAHKFLTVLVWPWMIFIAIICLIFELIEYIYKYSLKRSNK